MSSPIAISRSNKATFASAAASSPSSSSMASTSLSSSPSSGLYVPVHKRSGSSSSRASSPSSPRNVHINEPQHSRIYTSSFLLSLRPYADESMKEKMRSGECPEVVMNRKMRKNLEFMEHQREKEAKMQKKNSQTPVSFPAPTTASTPAPAPVTAQLTGITPRQPLRRARATSRADRTSRKQVFKLRGIADSGNNSNWRIHGPVQPLAVV